RTPACTGTPWARCRRRVFRARSCSRWTGRWSGWWGGMPAVTGRSPSPSWPLAWASTWPPRCRRWWPEASCWRAASGRAVRAARWGGRAGGRGRRGRRIATARRDVEPVAAEALGRFLPAWHGIGRDQRGQERLREAVGQLQGVALPVASIETDILRARIPD